MNPYRCNARIFERNSPAVTIQGTERENIHASPGPMKPSSDDLIDRTEIARERPKLQLQRERAAATFVLQCRLTQPLSFDEFSAKPWHRTERQKYLPVRHVVDVLPTRCELFSTRNRAWRRSILDTVRVDNQHFDQFVVQQVHDVRKTRYSEADLTAKRQPEHL